ncbi:hypothetical protein H2198_000024 [Neophaeococcomyces mojaviensis]|uniref:Uncharacterized protein n=1 Tax=Neophaeococcomyces mojaviensis TaxID=3383035 RepID=A0ACC3AKW1_9EURO|nr:hypothetical protein H2198_000024 [Knufia sp. JES_112]
MGKDTVKDLAAKLFLHEDIVKDNLKTDVFKFLHGHTGSDEQSIVLDKDVLTLLTEEFIDTQAGREYFEHSPETKEWDHKCPREEAIQHLTGLIRLWQKNKKKTVKKNDVGFMLNNPKPLASPPINKTGHMTMKSLESAIPLPDEDRSSVTNWSQKSNLPIIRRDTVETEDMYGPLSDIPYRADREQTEETEDPELPDAADILAMPSSPQRRVESPTVEAMSEEPDEEDEPTTLASVIAAFQVPRPPRTPMRLAAGHNNLGLPSPPITGRKRTHDESASETGDEQEDANTSTGARSKQIRHAFTHVNETPKLPAIHTESAEQAQTTSATGLGIAANTSAIPTMPPPPTTARQADSASFSYNIQSTTFEQHAPVAPPFLGSSAVTAPTSSAPPTPISPTETLAATRTSAPTITILPQHPEPHDQCLSRPFRDTARSEFHNKQPKFSRLELFKILDYLHEYRQAAVSSRGFQHKSHAERKKQLEETKRVLTYLRNDVEDRIEYLDEAYLGDDAGEDSKMHG